MDYAKQDAVIVRKLWKIMFGRKKKQRPMSVENESPIVMKRRLRARQDNG